MTKFNGDETTSARYPNATAFAKADEFADFGLTVRKRLPSRPMRFQICRIQDRDFFETVTLAITDFVSLLDLSDFKNCQSRK